MNHSSPWSSRATQAAGILVLVAGSLVLLGWLRGVEGLKSLVPGLIPMKVNTSLGMILSGSALLILSRRTATRTSRLLAGVQAALVILLGGATLIEYLVGVDQWLIPDAAAAVGASQSGRMSPATAFSFLLTGLALAAATAELKRFRLPFIAAAGASVMATSGLAIIGYAMDEVLGLRYWNYTGMALHTAASFGVLGMGLIGLARSSEKLTWSLDRITTAGFAVGIATLLATAGLSFRSTNQLQQQSAWVSHTQEVLKEIQAITTDVVDLEAARRDYSTAEKTNLRKRVDQITTSLSGHLASTRELISDNPRQKVHIVRLGSSIADQINWVTQTMVDSAQQGPAGATRTLTEESGLRLVEQIRSELQAMETEEYTLLNARKRESSVSSTATFLLLPLGVFLSMAMLLLGLFFLNAGSGERERVEKALRESEELFSKAFRLSPDCVVIVRLPDRTVVRANDALCRLWGSTAEEVVGRPSPEYTTWLNEDERRAFMQRLQENGECLNWETTLRLADGRQLEFNISCRLITFNGEPCILSVLRDITEQKRAETAAARLAAIVQSSDDAIIGMNLSGVITSWNPGADKIFGYTAEEIVGQPILRLIPAQRQREEAETLARVRRGESIRPFDTVRLSKNGSSIDVSITTSPIKDVTGKIIGASKVVRDISERKQAVVAVEESENRFRSMAESMPQLAWIARADGFIFWYNRRWYEYTGTTPEQMEGWGWQDVHDPAVLPEVMRGWKAAINERHPFEMEFPLRGADGRFRTFLTRVQPMKDSHGAVVQWFGTNTDVDVLKRMEHSLRQTQARLSSALAAGSIGTWTWDIRADRLVADDYTARAFSIDLQEAEKGLPAAAYLQAVLAEDRPGVADGLSRAIQSCGQYDIEYRVRQKEGGVLWLQARGRVDGDAEGNAVSFHGAVMDVTARKLAEGAVRASEEHFRFLNDLVEGTRRLTNKADIVEAMTRMLGKHLHASRCAYTEVDQDGERCHILHDYTDGCESTEGVYQLSRFGDRTATLLHSGQTLIIRDVDAEFLPGEGADMYNDIGIKAIITSPLINKGGLHAMMAVHQTTPRDWKASEIAIVQDVTERCWAAIERRTAEEEIQQLNVGLEQRVAERTAQLESANKELEAFSYTVSHDLRAPLRAVDGFSMAVMEDFGPLLPEEGRRQLQIIRQSAQRMGALIDDLLTFSRFGRQVLAKKAVDMSELVRAALAELGAPWPNRQVTTHLGDLPESLGDPSLLKQVWINLLSNALKYTGKKEHAVIEVGYTMTSKKIESFFVRDNGSGFDMRYANKLFGVFQRLHRVEDYEGTGVGLAIVQRIIQRHGGQIWAEAEPDRGATFYFTLECVPPATKCSSRTVIREEGEKVER